MKYSFTDDLDDPSRTEEHSKIIKKKPFLKKLYMEWYNILGKQIADLPEGKIIELGSGGGFIKELYPQVITSDIMPLSSCDMCFSAENIPLEDNTVAAYFMLNVFHHIPNPEAFLREAERTLVKNGKIIMVDPGNSFLSRIIYKHFHHEDLDVKGGWTIVSTGPMSSSNQALPYIYFIRDKKIFESKFPDFKIVITKLHTPFRYILSGGVSMRAIAAGWSFGFFTFVEKLASPFSSIIGMFQTTIIQKL